MKNNTKTYALYFSRTLDERLTVKVEGPATQTPTNCGGLSSSLLTTTSIRTIGISSIAT